MSNKKWGKNLLYDDYEDDLVDYDNYNEEYYSEFECQEGMDIPKTKGKDNTKGKALDKKPKQQGKVAKVKKPNQQGEAAKVKKPSQQAETAKVKKPNRQGEETQMENQNDTTSNALQNEIQADSQGNRCIMLSTLNILVLGHIDAGKSTLIGALLYNLSYVSEQTVKKYEHVRESSKYTFILDEEDDERERNITLFNKKKEFYVYYTKGELQEAYNRVLSTQGGSKKGANRPHKSSQESADGKNATHAPYTDRTIFDDFYKNKTIHSDVHFLRKINIFDTPGHNELVTNLHTWSFFADSAILVVDANNIYNQKNDETYRNISILEAVGISNVIVAVNKLDLFDYDSEVFEDICKTIKSFFQCAKSDSIYNFVLSNNFYVKGGRSKKSSSTATGNQALFEPNLTFIPLSAYKNLNVVKFEEDKRPLLNNTFSLYDEIKYMNLRKDLFRLKVCAEVLSDKKMALTFYYNFVSNNDLFLNNIFYNFCQDGKGNITNSIKKSPNEEDTFVGVVQDLTESNNMINANIKVLHGFLKSKNNYVLLPVGEKITVKKIEKDTTLCKYVNIDDLCDYLTNTKNLPFITKVLEQEMAPKKSNNPGGNGSDSHTLRSAHNGQDEFESFINILPKIIASCPISKNAHITNDIVENVFFKIDDNKIKNGSVLVNNVPTNSEIKSAPYGAKNTTFACNKVKVLIKVNQVKIPLIIGRVYLLYSLNFSHSVTVQNILYMYKNKSDSLSYHRAEGEGKLDAECKANDEAQITDLKNYVKNVDVLYEKVNNKKCLRSDDIGVLELLVNDNSFMCTQCFRPELNYYISQDNPFFSVYDLLSCSISPLSRFILSEENKIVASGLVIGEA
ncbi:elongation factor Tu, putative [Plasmodium knowlesi strain H]|uniref:Elongation factor Tu, putative n=3 Tax=Plasmodium knowlesi TaxID=5850 RepID=A0A5K1UT35_PLAKH|nr:elongation factor Tu, putative [Plasmodium knowlesi strain H]OTN67472.1 putative Elongation factor Tu [Plasmodium knowlesi]CAA9987588.1 elongation factor Tu, putative [Plasmodium knowlesi strain H]SBO27017.1 elongation factor Tu, putative [Plasmodium knowlesi strain H]SBO29225.1 elongation factor Tu, putative [Plasmodium knowlesi strain H]VVS77062.1 elongation factor Tu, putative [Plasmodium knowlesi strain H]|eukprot:XP_002258590.1 GTP-binding protein, putative [Plasmodium knowlesi strain H]